MCGLCRTGLYSVVPVAVPGQPCQPRPEGPRTPLSVGLPSVSRAARCAAVICSKGSFKKNLRQTRPCGVPCGAAPRVCAYGLRYQPQEKQETDAKKAGRRGTRGSQPNSNTPKQTQRSEVRSLEHAHTPDAAAPRASARAASRLSLYRILWLTKSQPRLRASSLRASRSSASAGGSCAGSAGG